MRKNKSSSDCALVGAVAGKNLAGTILEWVEVALDQGVADGFLKDIPFLGSLVSLGRAGKSISDEVFLRQIERFMVALDRIPLEDRERFIQRFPDASEEQKRLGENLLLTIKRLDDIEKPVILARFFAAYILSRVDYLTFTRLARSLERFNIELLPNLCWFYTREGVAVENSEEIIHELSLAGLVTASLEKSGTLGGGANYICSELGRLFLSIGFDVESEAR